MEFIYIFTYTYIDILRYIHIYLITYKVQHKSQLDTKCNKSFT